ncbi:MAG: branched-chain amino acid ABC transporter substrate-binding protein [Arthrospira sp. SH-MAG29]|nr:branched-chain amino acid ABC transporter substrate-binding protein [Arthrospira sp. SH-MAG29]MBS0016545.1 branched-chain amino acid ABC transporter substrate-binding protein [Arthrospira sp. SH-MAG29]
MLKFKLPLLSLFFSVATWLSGCTQEPPFECTDAIACVTINPGEPIKIGVLQSLSGGTAPGGIDQVRTIQLVIEQQGDILNRPILLNVQDERCSPEGGANSALRLVANPQVIGILGTNCSGAAVTASKIMSTAGLVMISGANTSPSLTSVGNQPGDDFHPGYFRVIYNDAIAGKISAEFARWVLGIDRVAVIGISNIYSQSLLQMFTESFTKIGGEVVFMGTIDPEDTNLKPVLTGAINSEAQLLFFPLGKPDQGAMLVRQAQELLAAQESQKLIFLGDEALMSEQFLQAVGDDGIGMYLAGPALIDSPEVEQLQKAYHKKYNQLPTTTLYSFASDATNLLLDAIISVSIIDSNGSLHIGRQALRDALYNTDNFPGLTGNLTCNKFGDCGAIAFQIYRLDDPATGIEGLSQNIVYSP